MSTDNSADKKRVLIVDDEQGVIAALTRALRPLNVELVSALSGEEGLEVIASKPIDVVVSDLNMPGIDGHEFLRRVSELCPETIRIMLTASSDMEEVLRAVNQGHVWGFMQKPWDNKALMITLEQALDYQTVLAERSRLQRKVKWYESTQRPQLEGFIGSSVPMQFVYTCIEQAAPSNASVWITGASGTGKEVAAQAIHNLSKRADKPFVALNCAAIPHDLMESEIFGHVKGAFTGAVANREGAASQADGGTLFLDEIGEMDIGLQAKLLRFIQLGEFKPVGASKDFKSDIRFVCATNRNALEAIQQGKLREDLYYRLNVIPLDIPPLRERGQDIISLAKHFLTSICKTEQKTINGFTLAAEKALLNQAWPGNVRQLQNVIYNAVVMATGPLIDVKDLPAEPSTAVPPAPTPSAPEASFEPPLVPSTTANTDTNIDSTTITPLAELERQAIEQAINQCNENIVQAANALGVSPSTLYRKLQSWGAD